MISFFVDGKPETKGSTKGFGFVRKNGPRAGTIGVNIKNDNPRAKAWAARVRDAALRAVECEPLAGPVAVRVVFHLARPKSHFRKGGILKPNAPPFPDVKPDGDKLERCAWDALTGIAFKDDAQIVQWSGGKVYAVAGLVGAQFTVSPAVAG